MLKARGQDLTAGSQPTSPTGLTQQGHSLNIKDSCRASRTPAEHQPLTSYIPPGRPLVLGHCWKVTAPKLESAHHCTGEALGSEGPQAGKTSLGRNREQEEEKGQRRGGKIERILNYNNVSVPVVKVIYSTQLWLQFGSGTRAADLPDSPPPGPDCEEGTMGDIFF